MKNPFHATESLIHAIFGDLTPNGKFWAYLFLIGSLFACFMSFDFGRNTSIVHGGMLAVITVCAGLGWHEAHKRFEKRAFLTCLFTALACLPLQGFEFITHSGYAAGFRGESVTVARVQNAKYEAAQEATAEDKTNNEIWKKQLASLIEQNAWAGTVKAEGLRAQLDAAQKAIDLEAARGGCKAKCLIEMEKKAKLEKEIAIAEQAADLTKRIEATQRILDKKREVAVKTDKVSSAVEQADNFMARAIGFIQTGNLKATDDGEDKAHFGLNIAMALTTTIGTAFAGLMTGLNRRRETDMKAEKPTARIVGRIEPPKNEPGRTVVKEILRLTDPRSACLDRRAQNLCA